MTVWFKEKMFFKQVLAKWDLDSFSVILVIFWRTNLETEASLVLSFIQQIVIEHLFSAMHCSQLPGQK